MNPLDINNLIETQKEIIYDSSYNISIFKKLINLMKFNSAVNGEYLILFNYIKILFPDSESIILFENEVKFEDTNFYSSLSEDTKTMIKYYSDNFEDGYFYFNGYLLLNGINQILMKDDSMSTSSKAAFPSDKNVHDNSFCGGGYLKRGVTGKNWFDGSISTCNSNQVRQGNTIMITGNHFFNYKDAHNRDYTTTLESFVFTNLSSGEKIAYDLPHDTAITELEYDETAITAFIDSSRLLPGKYSIEFKEMHGLRPKYPLATIEVIESTKELNTIDPLINMKLDASGIKHGESNVYYGAYDKTGTFDNSFVSIMCEYINKVKLNEIIMLTGFKWSNVINGGDTTPIQFIIHKVDQLVNNENINENGVIIGPNYLYKRNGPVFKPKLLGYDEYMINAFLKMHSCTFKDGKYIEDTINLIEPGFYEIEALNHEGISINNSNVQFPRFEVFK